MACCMKRKIERASRVYDVMGGYKFLPDSQIKARLEVFKKRHCSDCTDRYDCNFVMYNSCDKKPK